jgi:hypothetical protein
MKIAAFVLLAACTSSKGGEPQMGTASATYGTDTKMLATGSAIKDIDTAGNMLVQLGDGGVDCSTNLSASFPPDGMYVAISVDMTNPGTFPNAPIQVLHSSGNHIDAEITDGMVTIDAIDTRVTGSVMLSLTGSSGPVSATGTFDVKKCF